MTSTSSTRPQGRPRVSNHLKWLANELPVTFVYVGSGSPNAVSSPTG